MSHATTGVPVGGTRSQTARTCTLCVVGSDEELQIPVTISTRVRPVKELLVQKTGCNFEDLQFMVKTGVYTKKLMDTDEVRSRVLVKGIASFRRQQKQYAHPHAIIGAGHNGLRQALVFAEEKDSNYVLFDRRDRIGGTSWLAHANKWSKVQTELGTYHLNYSDQCECPQGMSPWPSRDELLDHFEQVADDWGLRPHFRLSTDVLRYGVQESQDGTGDRSYNLTLRSTKQADAQETKLTVSSLILFPGNLTNPRREEYKGEDVFGGPISYGMFDETNYDELSGKNVAIVGFGAFAVENIRTCCEHRANKIYLVCRRKNICMPRMVSWWINGSVFPVSAGDVMREMEGMYKMIGEDPWSYYAVQSNESRSNVTIYQKARFGIGDIYFLSRYYGKTVVVEDTIKKLSRNTVHLDSGTKLENVEAVLKLLGFVAEWSVDKFLQLKHLYGFWVNDDYRVATISEFPTINAQRFSTTSLSQGAIGWCKMFYYFWKYPGDFEKLLALGMVNKHFPNIEKDEPGYVVDSKNGSQAMIVVISACPGLGEVMNKYDDRFKRSKQWGTHSLEAIQAAAAEDWMRYCQMFKDAGDDRPFPPYPFPVERLKKMVETQDKAEGQKMLKKGYIQSFSDEFFR
ncbi:unnamed protein product [Polarella glacialis]|uniref:Uncharacterized protein n=1 Tax=Polarella glacialis TaxID=89957 RepID=A0A813LEM8_POLGL|nr:unnamed protein product [Polarella glacialis]